MRWKKKIPDVWPLWITDHEIIVNKLIFVLYVCDDFNNNTLKCLLIGCEGCSVARGGARPPRAKSNSLAKWIWALCNFFTNFYSHEWNDWDWPVNTPGLGNLPPLPLSAVLARDFGGLEPQSSYRFFSDYLFH